MSKKLNKLFVKIIACIGALMILFLALSPMFSAFERGSNSQIQTGETVPQQ